MIRATILTAGLSLSVTAAMAQDIRGWKPATLYGPYADEVTDRPSDADLMATWPAKAAAKSLQGNALARCNADQAGHLSGCVVTIERPGGAGFGDALLSLAPKFRLTTDLRRPAVAPVFIAASWPVVDTAPDWRVQPRPGDFATTMTGPLAHTRREGVALMNCLLGVRGTLYDCQVFYQEPVGLGFGTMALRFASYLQFKPATLKGQPAKVGLTIPFHFSTETTRF